MIPPLVINVHSLDFLNLLSPLVESVQNYKEQLIKDGYKITHPQFMPDQTIPLVNDKYKHESMIFGNFKAFFNSILLINYYSVAVHQLDFSLFENTTSFQVTYEEFIIIQTFKEKVVK